MAPEIVVVNLDFDVDGDYETFISALREKLAHHPLRDHYIRTYGPWLREHPLLPEQRNARQPARWIHINLKFQDSKNKTIGTTIAVRDDNVYLIGFKNGNGKWYEFGFEGRSTRFIEGSTFLGCDMSYRDLVGDSAELVKLRLGKHDAYKRLVSADKDTREHLARMCVMICESARMMSHYNAVNGGWNNVGSKINLQQAEHIKNWSNMSRKLLSMRDPSPERYHLLAVVHLLLNSPPAEKGTQRRQQQEEQSPTPGGGGPNQQRRGSNPQSSSSQPASSSSGGAQDQGRTAGNSVRVRPLVEVYSVEVERGVGIDTVAVFNGKRGQIMYNYKHDPVQYRSQGTSMTRYSYYMDPLVLTGPYRAISADGSFVIRVDSIIPRADAASDEPSKVSDELFWDGYGKGAIEYDKVSTHITGIGRVHYAVLSDAVEAAIEVNLLLPSMTHVYGQITASCSSLMNSRQVVLFRREMEMEEKVELVPSSADSMVPLELCRSVIAVPVHSRDSHVRIWVELHAAATPNYKDDIILKGGINFYFYKDTGEIVVRSFRDFFVPLGGSDPRGGTGASGGYHGAATISAGHKGTDDQCSVEPRKVKVNITSPGFHISSHDFMDASMAL